MRWFYVILDHNKLLWCVYVYEQNRTLPFLKLTPDFEIMNYEQNWAHRFCGWNGHSGLQIKDLRAVVSLPNWRWNWTHAALSLLCFLSLWPKPELTHFRIEMDSRDLEWKFKIHTRPVRMIHHKMSSPSVSTKLRIRTELAHFRT